MEPFGDLAADLLTAAVASGVTVDESYVAPGPRFARNCRAIVVYGSTPGGARPLQRSDFTGTCAVVPQIGLTVVFCDNCVPTVDDSKRPLKLPDPSVVQAYSVAFLNDTALIFDAVLGWAPSGDCSRITVSDGIVDGPLGRRVEVRWPVLLTLT